MGRLPKTGLDYFFCDVGWMADSKFRRLKLRYGILAPYVYQIVLTLIYGNKGYYVEAGCMEELCFDILDFLQGKNMPDAETIAALVEDFTQCGLFDRELYERERILTSRRVQREFYNSTAKRSHVQVDKRYWLLSVAEMKTISLRSHILSQFVSDGINEISDGRNRVSDVKNTQRRQDKIREEKTREDQSRADKSREDKTRENAAETAADDGGMMTDETMTDETNELRLLFREAFGRQPEESFVREMQECLREGMTVSDIRHDIERAADRHPSHPEAYVRTILRASAQRVQGNAAPQPLADWERDWLRGLGLPEPEAE